MNSTAYQSKSKFVVRQKSASVHSIPNPAFKLGLFSSRQFSVMDIMTERQSTVLRKKTKELEEAHQQASKDDEIHRLKSNLEMAVSTAINERLQSSKDRQDVIAATHSREYLLAKLNTTQKELAKEHQQLALAKQELHLSQQRVEQMVKQQADQAVIMAEKHSLNQQLKLQNDSLTAMAGQLESIQPLKNRIITLENAVRDEKILTKSIDEKLQAVKTDNEGLLKQLALVKPKEQELKERIAYLDRIYLDLERKMEDFNRRENDYIKQITLLKVTLQRTTSERNDFKLNYEVTLDSLKDKMQLNDSLSLQLQAAIAKIQSLSAELAIALEAKHTLENEYQQKVEFYREQNLLNARLKQQNEMLASHQQELQRVIQSETVVAEQINLVIVSKIEEIRKGKEVVLELKKQVSDCEQKFTKLDKLLEEGSLKSQTEVRESFYMHVRLNNQLSLQVKEMAAEFDEKVLRMGEDRDCLARTVEMLRKDTQTKVEQSSSLHTQYLLLHKEKSEEILLLESANDQLLKLKRDYEAQIVELNKVIDNERKEAYILKLKAADLFKAKKELEEARKNLQRYQDMIAEQNETAKDLHSQLDVLRGQASESSELQFLLRNEKALLELKVKEQAETMRELDVDMLQKRKEANERNSHLLNDCLEKLSNSVKSLSFYFNCAFCNELPASPVTLALCGHNYCHKCKEAYAESCYECDNGLPIERVFPNKFLKQVNGKYRFLCMVVLELASNFSKH